MVTERDAHERFESSNLAARQLKSGQPYLEFLRRASMSMGLYVLDVDAVDDQQPHRQDEVYYVIEGRAILEVGGDQRAVQPGSIIYVAAGVAHRFQSVTAKLSVLVYFAPAET